MSVFIRLHDETTQQEININVDHIASFLPTEELASGSVIRMANGMSHNVSQSNRSIRHAIRKGHEILTNETD